MINWFKSKKDKEIERLTALLIGEGALQEQIDELVNEKAQLEEDNCQLNKALETIREANEKLTKRLGRVGATRKSVKRGKRVNRKVTVMNKDNLQKLASGTIVSYISKKIFPQRGAGYLSQKIYSHEETSGKPDVEFQCENLIVSSMRI
ncbi:MAG: hypothetical protein HRT47_01585 [Candidatus Caenarcaniphilales bacterium]|nr:hypothetical protein [Candidatus Caenarcaniphilales bacterium]